MKFQVFSGDRGMMSQKSMSTQIALKANNLFLYVLYKRPIDFPNDIVLRPWNMNDGRPQPETLFETVEQAREYCRNNGLICLGRHADDDPVIVETWI
jgi:hypothetical protein